MPLNIEAIVWSTFHTTIQRTYVKHFWRYINGFHSIVYRPLKCTIPSLFQYQTKARTALDVLNKTFIVCFIQYLCDVNEGDTIFWFGKHSHIAFLPLTTVVVRHPSLILYLLPKCLASKSKRIAESKSVFFCAEIWRFLFRLLLTILNLLFFLL